VACLLPAAASTRANPVSWNWWTTTSSPAVIDPTGSAGMTLTGVAGPTSQVPPIFPTSAPTEVTLFNMKAFNTGGSKGTVYNIGAQPTPITVTLFLQDGTSAGAPVHQFVWHEQITGQVVDGSVHFQNQFVDTGSNPLTQQFTFAGTGDTFSVTPDVFDSPSVSGVVASSSALVSPPGSLGDGTTGGTTGGPNGVPEPSTVLLSCLGLSCLGAASWRKWRARR
jgi:hypothetical protein